MSKKKQSDDVVARFQTAGASLARLGINWSKQAPWDGVMLKSISIKCEGDGFFVIMRGSDRMDDVVQFFRVEYLENIGSTVMQKIVQGEWKPDKYSTFKK